MVFRDITAERAAELQRERDEAALRTARDAAQAATRELEAFSYSVAHDLRTPLRGIDGFSQALLEDYDDVLDEEGKDYLRRVRAAAQRMGQLIDDLLGLSRLTRSELCRDDVDLTALAREIGGKLHQAFPGRVVGFLVAEGLRANADGRLLRIVLENLLGNAWKFTSKQANARVEVGVAEDGGGPAYFVRDNGAGFDMAFASKLFGAFQRLHKSTEFEGTGIGLATVQRIIHRHGGRLWANAAPNQGATFHFTL
jgi:light-regulated signal transduction histidine kinase (bacteriophytochrome)